VDSVLPAGPGAPSDALRPMLAARRAGMNPGAGG